MTHPTTVTDTLYKTKAYAAEARLDTKWGHHYVARDLKGCPGICGTTLAKDVADDHTA